jgi:hypothetical protein
MVGTRSLSSGAHSRDPVALPTLQVLRNSNHRMTWLRPTFDFNIRIFGAIVAPAGLGVAGCC